MGVVIPFHARQTETALRIPLYGDGEVKLTVACIQIFGDQVIKNTYWCVPPFPTEKNLKLHSPAFVVECLKLALLSGVFSQRGCMMVKKILDSIETVEVKKEA